MVDDMFVLLMRENMEIPQGISIFPVNHICAHGSVVSEAGKRGRVYYFRLFIFKILLVSGFLFHHV